MYPHPSSPYQNVDHLTNKRQCWRLRCKSKAFLFSWAGWTFCLKHWWEDVKQADSFENKWVKIKGTRLF